MKKKEKNEANKVGRKRKKKIVDSSTSDGEEWVESGSSIDDVSNFDENTT